MSEIKFTLPGPDTVTLTGQTIDKLIRAGDGDATLLYLYILRTRGLKTSEEASKALGKGPGAIASAMALLSRLGLVQIETNQGEDSFASHDAAEPPQLIDRELRRYSIDEIKADLEVGSVFHSLVDETQRSLDKLLSPDELERLYGIYDDLHMPPEVILQLITHCISESRSRSGGRKPSVRYIEKAAYTWVREGVLSLDKAEVYLKTLEARKSARGEIKHALQIKDRELSETEKRYVDEWIAMGFGGAAVGIAFDRTVVNTGKLAWSYMDKIMKSWHGKGLHSPQEIMQMDKKAEVGGNISQQKAPEQKFGAADQEEIARMQRILKKIVED